MVCVNRLKPKPVNPTVHQAENMFRYLLFVLLCIGITQSSPAADVLEIGAAEVEITPPNGFPMAGYYHERLATGTIDPLKAKAIAFRQGELQAVLVVNDLTGISVDLTTAVRQRASKQTGIPTSNIILSATHSHTAPEYYLSVFQLLQGGTAGQEHPERLRYAEQLIENISAAIVAAHKSLAPAVVQAGSTVQEEPVSFNRRFVMRDGSVKTWMNYENKDVVRAAGPIDPEIGLIAFKHVDAKQPLAMLSNFALHLDTVGGMRWSADYPYYVEQELRSELGKGLVSVFGTGCCGDINHADPQRRERNKTDFIGGSLGKSIRRVAQSLPAVTNSRLTFHSKTISLPLQEFSDEQIARAAGTLKAVKSGTKVDFFEQVTAYKIAMVEMLRNKQPRTDLKGLINWGISRQWSGIGHQLPVEVQTITIGDDVGIVCLPGEVFVDLGLAIKRASPYRTTLVIELCTSVETIYIPTRAACAGGSYEVTNSTVQPGSGEMLVEAAIELLRQSRSSRS